MRLIMIILQQLFSAQIERSLPEARRYSLETRDSNAKSDQRTQFFIELFRVGNKKNSASPPRNNFRGGSTCEKLSYAVNYLDE